MKFLERNTTIPQRRDRRARCALPLSRVYSYRLKVNDVDRYTSHVIFLMRFAHAYHTAWLKTSHPTCL